MTTLFVTEARKDQKELIVNEKMQLLSVVKQHLEQITAPGWVEKFQKRTEMQKSAFKGINNAVLVEETPD